MSTNQPVPEEVKLLNSISAYRTLVDNYPILESVNSLIDGIVNNKTSINFSLDLLTVLGVDNQELIEWLISIITKDNDKQNGVLQSIEESLKLVIKTTLFSMISCNQNPIIADKLMTQYTMKNGGNDIKVKGQGISIPMNLIDLIGKLRISPLDISKGKFYYFDIQDTTLNQYKSKDFDGYLWYVTNKGLTFPESEYEKLCWKDRLNGGNDDTFKGILYSEFTENGSGLLNNIYTFKIDYNTYGDKRRNPIGGTLFNKTIYEFNNDFINSLIFFDTQVIITQIIDKLTGTLTVNGGLSITEITMQKKIEAIIKRIIESEDTEISDCFFSFSNDEYDMMIEEAALLHAGVYKYESNTTNGLVMDYNDLLNSINEINENSTLQEQVTIIENTFNDMNIIMNSDDDTSNIELNLTNNIINKFIQQLSYSVISSVLTPKVMVLYMINMDMMGLKTPENIDDFIKALLNPITQIVTQIKNIILKELYDLLLIKIQPLLDLFVTKLTFESVSEYKELITNLLDLARGEIILSNSGTGIDSVNYADILNQEISLPPNEIC